MKITFLGSGSAFCHGNYQSNILIEAHDKKLLIDCGSDIRFSLRESGVKITDIDAIYVSHLHADHVGGLEYTSFVTYFTPKSKKPILFGETGLLNDLWEHSLRGGLESIQTIDADLTTYFDKRSVPQNGSFNFDGIIYKLVQTIHVIADRTFKKSYGLIFNPSSIVNVANDSENKKVFITTDTQFSPYQIRDFINQADVVFHDCELSKYPSNVHAHYNDLKTLPESMKSKMWLYHYNPDDELPNAVADGFQGFVLKGQVFEI